ncbi:hypothetical protein HYFRA_00000970 [Hymenoscyphus fraxineus]|uniref:Uncharacterized protein n=1 Tax=Hymenoscyphus fraxineus TaxID=746836 RepID=A0A9N9KU82_9HELO|nr:hypothetical protein HYFRA_00000970 [Hymenoscyphus fraxineus]
MMAHCPAPRHRPNDFAAHDTETFAAPAPRKASSPSKALQERSRNAPVIQRPIRKGAEEDGHTTKHSKSKQMVSIAGVLKRKANAPRRDRRCKSRREPSVELDLLEDVRDGIEEARASIIDQTEATFDSSYKTFVKKLNSLRKSDAGFLNDVDDLSQFLSRPLDEETVATSNSTKSDGTEEWHHFQLGVRLAEYKTLVEKEEAKQNDLWNQWDELQNEYIELGAEVFGSRAFGEDANLVKGKHRGFKKEMDLLDLEFKARVEELEEEVSGISVEYQKKLKTAEKELDAQMKKEQAKLLTALLSE